MITREDMERHSAIAYALVEAKLEEHGRAAPGTEVEEFGYRVEDYREFVSKESLEMMAAFAANRFTDDEVQMLGGSDLHGLLTATFHMGYLNGYIAAKEQHDGRT